MGHGAEGEKDTEEHHWDCFGGLPLNLVVTRQD